MAFLKYWITYWYLKETNTTYSISNKTRINWKPLRDNPFCETRW